ncbi:hypothetical protein BD410DRAFT_789646 [Rickenella mellea]|uniref:Replication protein A C-terminal domain-containing protein n=1 Tax=Rickenella mellea TaxID=50990 RepID=A0A4Y7Q3Q0_9AGAM|nr:hypothetical protein BD410DRAFT_789646 [Rickenella mellea]
MTCCFFVINITLVTFLAFLLIRQLNKRRIRRTAPRNTPDANTQSVDIRLPPDFDNEKYATTSDVKPTKEPDEISLGPRKAITDLQGSPYSVPPNHIPAPWLAPPLIPVHDPYCSANQAIPMSDGHPQGLRDIPGPIACLSIKQCQEATLDHVSAQFFLGGHALGQVRVLAEVILIDNTYANYTYRLYDGSASIDALHLTNSANVDYIGYMITQNMYVSVTGTLKQLWNGERFIHATYIEPFKLRKPHEIDHVAPALQHEPPTCVQRRFQPLTSTEHPFAVAPGPKYHVPITNNLPVAANGAYDPFASLTPLQREVFDFIDAHPRQDMAGVHFTAIARAVQAECVHTLRVAIERLIHDGHVFSTIHDDHFASGYDFPVTANGTYDTIPDLSTLKRKVVDFMQTQISPAEGLHIDAIARGVGIAPCEAREALDNLNDEGKVFSTIDDFHFAFTGYTSSATGEFTHDMAPHLPPLQRKIVNFIQIQRSETVGVEIAAIARGVGRNVREVSDALESLTVEGEVISTTDKSHFDIIEVDHAYRMAATSTNTLPIDAEFTYLPLSERKIIEFIQAQPPTNVGVHITAIAGALAMDMKKLSDAIDNLLEDGYIFSTIDESHFQITF